VFDGTQRVGRVASGAASPTLGKNLGTAFVPPALAVPGRSLSVEIRGANHPIETVPLPFYKRPPRRSR
jgi:aminomethyltransferase